MEEIWRDIKGYDGLYQVSNLGRIKSLKRAFHNPKKKIIEYNYNEIMLKFSTVKQGYKRVMLHNNKIKKAYLVHRLVADCFIPNLNNYPIINHKDSDKSNNNAENLEWSTYSMNTIHGYKFGNMSNDNLARAEAMKKTFSKSVMQYDLKGNFIRRWESINQIKRELGYSISNISRCCNREQEKANNYFWEFEKKVNYYD